MRLSAHQPMLLGQVTAGRMQLMAKWPGEAMHELHSLCKQSIRRMHHLHLGGWSSEASSSTSSHGWKVARQRHQLLHNHHQHPYNPPQNQQFQQQCQQQQQLPHRLSNRWHFANASGGRGGSSSLLSPLRVQQSHRAILPALKTPNQILIKAAAGSPLSLSTMAARPASSRLLSARLINRSGSSSWRAWVKQQLGSSSSSSRAYSQQLFIRATQPAAAAPAKAAARSWGSSAAAAGSRAWSSAAAAAGGRSLGSTYTGQLAAGWWDTWALWGDKTSGFMLSSLLNSLNLVGNKLPMALGLLLVDMAHNSPMLGGSRADSLESAYLPDRLPEGGFYADGGAVYTAASSNGKDGSSSSNDSTYWESMQGAWSEVSAALAAGSRLIWLGCIWLPALVTSPAVMWGGVVRAWWLVLLRLSLEASGPAFIKWGQWAATRHDVFAHDVCDALEKLHTAAPAHSFRYTCKALTASFCLPPSELFDWIEEQPLACGSIGQVHRGRLSATGAALTGCAPGDTVAIKVRHPGVSQAIERDFETMVWLAHVAGQLIPATRSLRLDDTLKQFAAPLHEQVDLSREAANLKRFNNNFKRAKAVSFPHPLYPLVSPDVLVESFEVGRHISHYITAQEGSNPYRVRLAELGSGTMLQMMLVDNLIHSDLHPGNILVRLEPPQGLLGLAYNTLRSLSNPEGPVMRALEGALDKIPQQQQNASSSSDEGAAAEALTVSASPAAVNSSSGSGKWDVVSSFRRLCAADSLSKVQAYLSGVAAGWLQPHIVLLDVGMATELSPEDQHNMVGLFRSFASLDGANVARWVLRFSGTDQACSQPQAFVEDMQTTFETLKKTIAAHQAAEARWKQQQQQQQAAAGESGRLADGNSGSGSGAGAALVPMPERFDSGAEALATVLELVRVHGVSLPGHICAVVVTTLILEGWSNKLAPEHSVLSQVQGMFSPSMYSWHDRMDGVVDDCMDRGDTALSLA